MYDSAGVSVASETQITGMTGSNSYAIAFDLFADGTKALICDMAASPNIAVIEDDGTLVNGGSVQSATTIGTAPTSNTSRSDISVKYFSNDLIAFCRSIFSSGTSYVNVGIGTLADGGTVKLSQYNSTAFEYAASFITDDGVAMGMGGTSVTWRNHVALIQNTAIFGVAQATVADGEAVPVATRGTHAINQTTLGSLIFDNTATAIPGARGVIAGGNATLFGLEPK